MTKTPRAIDLNADLGEGCAHDARLLELVTSASVACGAHAGDLQTMTDTLREAQARGVAVGAHPGYPNREHFGRKEQDLGTAAITDLVLSQVRVLARIAADVGAALAFLKPHGALYNQAQREAAIAQGLANAAEALGLPLLGQPGSEIDRICRLRSLRFIAEGFPDRRYEADGRLVPRSRPGALLKGADVDAQAIRLAREGIVETLCIHGDAPEAVEHARAVREALQAEGIGCRFWGEALR